MNTKIKRGILAITAVTFSSCSLNENFMSRRKLSITKKQRMKPLLWRSTEKLRPIRIKGSERK